MFVGWEGVGLCSYLLIGFWYQKKSATDAGKKAFIVNRIGDFGFLLGVLLHLRAASARSTSRSVARDGRRRSRPETTFGTLSLITLLLFVGATGKSAQIPLYVWLPDAMEGPTPVSALIHAATMVTAGVYMIGRNAVLFSHAPETLAIVAVVGAATALMAGTIGLVQNDIKRVLAYSTVSQLGYMFLAMGVGAFGAGIFHLYTHAFFKALLFLGSGAVIHALARRAGSPADGRARRRSCRSPTGRSSIGALAIAGVPGLAGFFSKDEILFRTFASGHTVLWVVGLLTSLLTAIYMFRLVFLAFHGAPRTRHRAPGTRTRHRTAPGTRHPAPGTRHASARRPAGDGARAGRPCGRLDRRPATSACRTRSADRTGSSSSSSRASRPAQRGGGSAAATTRASSSTLMAVSTLVALARHRPRGVLLPRNRDGSRRAWRARFAGAAPRAREQVLRRRDLRRRDRPADSHRLGGRAVEASSTSASSTARSTASPRPWAACGELLRRLQTGSVRAYAASLFLGVVLILGYYLWR